jgi:hypothetical protein
MLEDFFVGFVAGSVFESLVVIFVLSQVRKNGL